VPKEYIVLKPSEEVLKQRPLESLDQRLSALESDISELKSLLFSNEAAHYNESKKENSEGEIRTRVVASAGPLLLLTL